MLHFELHDDVSGDRIHLGSIGEFLTQVLSNMQPITETIEMEVVSKLFSTRGIASGTATTNMAQVRKEFIFAADRVIQGIRDKRERQ